MVKAMMMVSVFAQQHGKRRRAKNNSGSDNSNNSKYIAQQDFIFLWEEAAVGLVDELLILASQEYVNATSCSKPLRSKLRELQEPCLSSSPIT